MGNRQSSIRPTNRTSQKTKKIIDAYLEELDFLQINKVTHSFAGLIEKKFSEISKILLDYESWEVVEDETNRTLDLLKNLKENKDFFSRRIGAVTAFLPRNQPLYAFACFVLVPSLMATEVHFRIPSSMRHFFPKLLDILEMKNFFPNVFVSHKERFQFLKERSGLLIDSKTQETLPVSEAVIFTGIPSHAEKLRLIFDSRTLFICNGAGHNPVVISSDADLKKSVEAVLALQLYNQGQDCAAPNSILIHKKIFKEFLQLLRKELNQIKIGTYHNKENRVGPITEPEDLIRIETILIENKKWLDESTQGVIRASESLVEPTIITKPLNDGGNFKEVFAPIIFAQEYEYDADLSKYFENPHYAQHAMYVSLYGSSKYVENLIKLECNGKILHDKKSILINKHLHMPGIERGTQPYGGYGAGASNLSIHGKTLAKPTLPQRDIFQWLVEPLSKAKIEERKKLSKNAKKFISKNIKKLLKMGNSHLTSSEGVAHTGMYYIDSHATRGEGKRYTRLDQNHIFEILLEPNLQHVASMEPYEIEWVRQLRKFLIQKNKMHTDSLTEFLYELPKNKKFSDQKNRSRQLKLFEHIYELLLAKKTGPRLAQFLLDIDKSHISHLLNI